MGMALGGLNDLHVKECFVPSSDHLKHLILQICCRFTYFFTFQVEIPFGVTANKNTLYYTNWVTTSPDTGSVTSYNTVTKETRNIIQHLSNPSGIVYVNTTGFAPLGI